MYIRTADFAADHAAIRKIRFAVFVDEQKVPEEMELDDRDLFCTHLLACSDDGEPIGTGRIDLSASGKIGRLAVVSAERGRGVGMALMERFHGIAKEHGLGMVWCNAQAVAVPFYRQLGYRVTGDRFDEAGIEHVRMERAV